MTSVCTPTPTATEFATITTFSLSTSAVLSTSVKEPVITTITSPICLDIFSVPNGACATVGSTTIVETSKGATLIFTESTTLSIPITVTSATETLFATCSTTTPPTTTPSSSSSSTTSSSSSSSSFIDTKPTPPPTSTIIPNLNTSLFSDHVSFSTTFSTFLSTPPPTTFVTQTATTLGDGNVVNTDVTVVSSPPPVTVVSASIIPSIQQNDTPTSGSKPQTGVILGSILGGVLAMMLFAGLFWLFRKRMRRNPWEDVLDEKGHPGDFSSGKPPRRDLRASTLAPDDPSPHGYSERPKLAHILSDERRPYQYGVVGHIAPSLADDGSSSSHTTPLPSPGLLARPPPPPSMTPGFGMGITFPHSGGPPEGSLTPTGSPLPRHSPAPSTASDQPLLPRRLSSPPSSPQPSSSRTTSMHSRTTSTPITALPAAVAPPMPIVKEEPRRRSTSVSVSPSTGTPHSSYIKQGTLTLANWNPNTDGLLIDMDSFDDPLPALHAPTSLETDRHSMASTASAGTATAAKTR